MISLGQASNYSVGQVFGQLFAWGTRKDSDRLRSALAQRYQVAPQNVALYHTGRSALTVAIQETAQHQPMNVIIPGLTCIAVVRAVRAAGCNPVFVDITADNLSYNYAKLEQRLQELAKNSPKAQSDSAITCDRGSCSANTFFEGPKTRASTEGDEQRECYHSLSRRRPGEATLSRCAPERPEKKRIYGTESKAIEPIDKNSKVCYNGSIVLVQNTLGIPWDITKIQTIAHKYQALIVEDLAHSAGRKYASDEEAGTVGEAAALSFGKGKAIDTISGGAVILRHHTASQPTKRPKASDRWRDRWYPFFGLLARHTGRLGQLAMGCLVKIHFVQRSADAELDTEHRLTHWQAKLALKQLAKLPSSKLRDYRLVTDRAQVLAELKQSGYNFSEIWYDTPVSPPRYAAEANFPTRSCPETVRIARQIVNFPTWYSSEKLQTAYEIVKKYEVK